VWGGRKHPKEELIRRFSVTDVKSMSTRFRINTDKFDAYARETAQLYIDTRATRKEIHLPMKETIETHEYFLSNSAMYSDLSCKSSVNCGN
jgi:hypothetical protein